MGNVLAGHASAAVPAQLGLVDPIAQAASRRWGAAHHGNVLESRWSRRHMEVVMAGPAQCRLGDKSKVPSCSHGCPGCPHTCVGPAVAGSPDVFVNGLPAIRVGDPGVHSSCCGPNTWKATKGSGTVFINGKKAHRKGDADKHCGGNGKMIEGSPDVFTGG